MHLFQSKRPSLTILSPVKFVILPLKPKRLSSRFIHTVIVEWKEHDRASQTPNHLTPVSLDKHA